MKCSEARKEMTPAAMAALIRGCPPGPWPHGWTGWDCVRDAHLQLLDETIAATQPFPEERFAKGRGIVVAVNAKPGFSSGKNLDHGYLPGAWVLVQELRRLGCTLPVTFAHLGAHEWDPMLTKLMHPYGVTCIDLSERNVTDPMRILAGWESKIFAMLHAGYEECMYLDADNIPLVDPTFLFDTQQYKYYGSIFWPDVPPHDRAEWLPEVVWKNVGLTYRDEVDFETGQLLVDMKRCWREMCLTRHLNEHSDYYYKFIFGDKSTFHLAWARLGTNWAIPGKGPGGNQASLIQHDFAGRQILQHCTRNKPSLAGYPSPGHVVRIRECTEHLESLKAQWSGKLWHNDNPTPEEMALKVSLEGKLFTYERVGIDSRPMRLLQEGRIGRGLAKLEVGWEVFIDENKMPSIIITSIDGAPTAILSKNDGEDWNGKWLQYERCECRLVPGVD